MKKLLPYANYLAAGAGIAGALLRQWTLVVGPDSRGLYPAAHPGWIGYLLIILAAAAALFLMIRGCGKNGTALPSGFFPLLGQAAAACGILLYSLPLLAQGGMLNLLGGLLGLCAAGTLAVVAWQNVQQKAAFVPAYLVIALFFALQLFLVGKQFGTETQLLRFLPQMLALGASALAAYELMGVGAGCVNGAKSLFWSLSAALLCFAAAPGAHWMYAAVGLWHLLGHCTLTAPAAEAEEAADPDGSTP